VCAGGESRVSDPISAFLVGTGFGMSVVWLLFAIRRSR